MTSTTGKLAVGLANYMSFLLNLVYSVEPYKVTSLLFFRVQASGKQVFQSFGAFYSVYG